MRILSAFRDKAGVRASRDGEWFVFHNGEEGASTIEDPEQVGFGFRRREILQFFHFSRYLGVLFRRLFFSAGSLIGRTGQTGEPFVHVSTEQFVHLIIVGLLESCLCSFQFPPGSRNCSAAIVLLDQMRTRFGAFCQAGQPSRSSCPGKHLLAMQRTSDWPSFPLDR